MRHRHSRRMAFSKFDVIKVCVLVILFCILGYSALTKFTFLSNSGGILHVEADYRPCDIIKNCAKCIDQSDNMNLCRNELTSVFKSANDKCKGYLKNLSVCRNHQRSPCRIETANVESCFSSVTGKTMQKWFDFSKNIEGDTNSLPAPTI